MGEVAKLRRLNATTYEADLPRARIVVGDGQREDAFVPCAEIYNFDDETKLRVAYAERPYMLLSDDPEAAEVERLTLTEGVVYPPWAMGVAYTTGDLCEHLGVLYECVQGHTSQSDWEPQIVPALWRVSTPPGVIGDWVQPLGAHDAYPLDAMVSHANKVWASLIEANVWEPGSVGAESLWQQTDGRVDVDCYFVEGYGEQRVGAFEFEIVLRDHPTSNVVEMQIETEGLTFHYQPALTPEEIAEGAHRPENVVGSYAVYHATCGQMHNGPQAAKKYQSGKAFHIYRPKVMDANGDWVWGVLHVDAQAGKLTITIDQGWLDTAAYPVRVDPTFGYVDANGDGIVGGSAMAMSPAISVNRYQAPAQMNITSMSAYQHTALTTRFYLGVYADDSTTSGGELKARSAEVEAVTTTAAWRSATVETTVAQGSYVWLACQQNERTIFYDTVSGLRDYKSASTYGTWPDPLGGVINFNAARYSLYATYDEVPLTITAAQVGNVIRLTITR